MEFNQPILHYKDSQNREFRFAETVDANVKNSNAYPEVITPSLFRCTSTTQIFQHKVKVTEVLTCVSVYPQLTTVRKQNLKRALETCTGHRVSVTNDLNFTRGTGTTVSVEALKTVYKTKKNIDFTSGFTVAKQVAPGKLNNLNRLVQTSETPGVVQPCFFDMVKSQYLTNYSFFKSAMATGVAYKQKTDNSLKSAPFDAVVTDRDSAPGAFVGFDEKKLANQWRGIGNLTVGKDHRMFKFDGTGGNVKGCSIRIGLGKAAVFKYWSWGCIIPDYKVKTRLVRFKS